MSSRTSFQSLRRLMCFAAIADAGSIRGGAGRLGLSVPVVSTALAELEEELEVKLAVRTTRKLALTEFGEKVYQDAQRMLASADSALQVAAADRYVEGELKLTAPIEIGTHWLPEILVRFQNRYPGINLTVDVDDTIVPLHSSVYDVAIQANYRSPGTSIPKLKKKSLVTLDTINLVCVAKSKPKIKWQNTNAHINTALIVQQKRDDHLIAAEKKTQKRVTLSGSKVIRTNSRETALAFVRSGLGAVLVMDVSVNDELNNKHLTRVLASFDFGHLSLELKIRDSLPSPAARALIDFLSNDFIGDRH